jgi:hypothetical protein
MVSFTPRPLYSQGKSPWYTLDRRLSGPQNRSGRGGTTHNVFIIIFMHLSLLRNVFILKFQIFDIRTVRYMHMWGNEMRLGTYVHLFT